MVVVSPHGVRTVQPPPDGRETTGRTTPAGVITVPGPPPVVPGRGRVVGIGRVGRVDITASPSWPDGVHATASSARPASRTVGTVARRVAGTSPTVPWRHGARASRPPARRPPCRGSHRRRRRGGRRAGREAVARAGHGEQAGRRCDSVDGRTGGRR